MAYVGAYYRKYKYPTSGGDNTPVRVAADDILKPSYKVDGLEPDVADANLLDNDIADIGRKLGAFQADIDAHIKSSVMFTPEQAVHNDELTSSRVRVIGSDDSASTVEPEVRRIFGEYQTAAFLDSLSDSDDTDTDSDFDDNNDIAGFNGGDDNTEHNTMDSGTIDPNGIISTEKSYHGINYYEVDNSKQYTFNITGKADETVDDQLGEAALVVAEVALGAGSHPTTGFDWNELLEDGDGTE